MTLMVFVDDMEHGVPIAEVSDNGRVVAMTPQMLHKEAESASENTNESPQVLSYKDRQGLAMGWAFSALGLFLLLAGLALGAAVIFNVGFVGWLIATALMAVVIVVVIATANYFVGRPPRYA